LNNANIQESAALQLADDWELGPTGALNIQRYWIVRLGFGLIWGIDATLKWLPGFRDNYLMMIRASAQGQPAWLLPFFHVWARAVAPAPGLFAMLTALAETAICLSLLLGIAQRAGFIFGAVFGLLIWAVGEGFGGPYVSGATDIGCAIMYSVLFAALLLAVPRATRASAPSLDSAMVARWPALAPLTFLRASRAHQREVAGRHRAHPGQAPDDPRQPTWR
jgi:thiosulfate dehydrogenase [quinone] large subunit